MPLLATLLGGLFTRLIDYFALYFTRKVALYLAAVAALVALTAALLAAFTLSIYGIKVSLPANVGTLTALLPDNLAQCLAAIGANAILKWTYDWNTTLIMKNLS